MPDPSITAYIVGDTTGMPLVAGPYQREWMDATRDRFAYRCLPLVLANQAGWFVRNPVQFTAHWNGGPEKKDLTINFPDRGDAGPVFFQTTSDHADQPPTDPRVVSHFGSGIVTISLPYLFRTPPGVNLWVKGPTNLPKDGAWPLEGIVEADWSPATFTMNWKITRTNATIDFAAGEPICMVVPVPRGLGESLHPRIAALDDDADVAAAYRAWDHHRRTFIPTRDPATSTSRWQKDYFLGRAADGSRFESHQTKIDLREFQAGESVKLT